MNTPKEKDTNSQKHSADAAEARSAEAVTAREQSQDVRVQPEPASTPMTVIPERKVRKPGRFKVGQLCGFPLSEELEKKVKK